MHSLMHCLVYSFCLARALSSSFSSQFIIFLCANLRIELVQLRITNSPSLIFLESAPSTGALFQVCPRFVPFRLSTYSFVCSIIDGTQRNFDLEKRPNETEMISVNRNKFMLLLPITFDIFAAADRRDEGHRTHILCWQGESRQESTDFMLFTVCLLADDDVSSFQ